MKILSVEFPANTALTVDEKEAIPFSIGESFQSPIVDYEELRNKPKLDGEEIIGDVHEKDPTVPSWAKSTSRPIYNASDVGAVSTDEMQSISIADLETLWNTV